MLLNHIALSGDIYVADADLINDPEFLIGEFRGGATEGVEETVVKWYGQSRVAKSVKVVRRNRTINLSEVAFNPETLGKVYDIVPLEKAATKNVTAIVAGGTEATLTTDPSSADSFQEDEPVVIGEETGGFAEGFVDGTPATQTVLFDDGAGAAVANVDDLGIMADLDYTDPQYFTHADDVLLDIGDAEDYSLFIRFKRRREGVMEVLMAKTADASDTAFGTTAGWVLFIDASNILRFAVNDGVDAYVLNGSTEIVAGEMRFVLVTFDESDASGCKIFLEGYDNTYSRTGTLSGIADCSNAGIFTVGAEADAGLPFDGYIAEIAVWSDTVLTAANALTYASAPGTEPGAPSAWWPVIELAAATTIDDEATAANALDLTLVGGTTTNFGTHSRTTSAVLTANLLGFDIGFGNPGIGSWTAGDAASELKKNTQFVKHGKRSFRIRNTDGSQASATHDVATTTGVEYHFHGWFRAPETPNGAAQLVDVDATPALGITVTQALATTGGTWYEIEFDFEAGDASTTIALGSGSVTSGDCGYWDSVDLSKNYLDTGGFESAVAASDWATTGAPTLDDVDEAEQSGTLCYEINSDTPASKYVSQDVTITSGLKYTFRGHIKAETAEKAVIVLSGAASVTLDNGQETTDWVKVTHRFTATTATLTVKIYGDGVAAWFDNFSVRRVDQREWHVDNLLDQPDKQFMLEWYDSNGKINEFFVAKSKIAMGPITFTNMDVVVEDLPVTVLDGYTFLVEN